MFYSLCDFFFVLLVLYNIEHWQAYKLHTQNLQKANQRIHPA